MFDKNLIAPCGMNCNICRAYLAYSRNVPKERGKVTHCTGCRPRGKKCAYLKGQCENLGTSIQFCFECADFPCHRLKTLDKRYRTRYNYSPVENLREIQSHGIEQFLQNQGGKYRCLKCGGVVSVHDEKCYDCGYSRKGNC